MARGWESKSVEAQQAEAAERTTAPKPRLSADEAIHLHRAEGLQLSRRQVLHQLDAAQNPRHREMLREALSELERQIQALKLSR